MVLGQVTRLSKPGCAVDYPLFQIYPFNLGLYNPTLLIYFIWQQLRHSYQKSWWRFSSLLHSYLTDAVKLAGSQWIFPTTEMRLIHTTSLNSHEFFGDAIPKYAILSHTWEKDEITLKELRKGRNRDKAGWTKIYQCCRLAKAHDFEFVWIDTCCIDKTSSAELSESINSMFQWYKNASLCFVYLCDVHVLSANDPISYNEAEFCASRWFTRAWTLQELLAPQQIKFIADDWYTCIGSKNGRTMRKNIASVTGISEDVLSAFPGSSVMGGCRHRGCSIAEIMSWASKRAATRQEDEAYALLGLCGINMPLLYGEGAKAFQRLQTELIRVSDDESIFCWSFTATRPSSTSSGFNSGFLSPSPLYFSKDYVTAQDFSRWYPVRITLPSICGAERSEYSITNRGLKMNPWLLHLRQRYGKPGELDDLTSFISKSLPGIATMSKNRDPYVVVLNDMKAPPDKTFAMLLLKDSRSKEDFIRYPELLQIDEWLIKQIPPSTYEKRTIYIKSYSASPNLKFPDFGGARLPTNGVLITPAEIL